jgi:hypothetical protein
MQESLKSNGRATMKLKLSGIIMVGIILVSTLFTGVAYAQDEELPTPGLTPDSPFYFFDKLGKNIGMFFAFGPEAKARKALRYAEERLAEAQLMAAKNKIKEMERATDDYEQYMARVRERLEEASQHGLSDNISERVALATSKHLDVLERVKGQVPLSAQEAITHAANVSINGQINALRALAKEKPEKAWDICDNITVRQMEKIKIRASDNVTSDNVTSAELTTVLDYAERIAALEDEMTEIAEAIGANVTALQERLAHSTANRLEVLSGVYEKVPEQARPAIENAIENSVRKYERTLDKLIDKNVTTAASVNETIDKMPTKLREKIQVSTANQLQIVNAVSVNASTKNRITTENRENTGNTP